MEIVSEPDIRSPEEAKAYMEELRKLLVALGVCDGNMEEGSLRCDANISLRPAGKKELGVKTEVKNMNSFKAVQKALSAEIVRQTKVLDEGGKLTQESRLYDNSTDSTMSMRSKEEAHDYRYFPEPDLVPMEIDNKWIDAIRKTISELPQAKKARYISEFKLPDMDATVLSSDSPMAKFFEESVLLLNEPKEISNWLIGDISAYMNEKKKGINDLDFTPAKLIEVIKLVSKGTISRKTAKEVLIKALDSGKSVNDIVAESGSTQISDEGELLKIVQDAINNNPKSAADYKAGEEPALFHLMGQIMKATKGRANPETAKKLLMEVLKNEEHK